MSTSSTPVASSTTTTAVKKPLVSLLGTPRDPRRAKIAKQLLAKRGYSNQFSRPIDRLVALDAKLTEFISSAELKEREETPGRWAKKGAIIGGVAGVPLGAMAGIADAKDAIARAEISQGARSVGKAADRMRLKRVAGQSALSGAGVGAMWALQGAAAGGIAGVISRNGRRDAEMRQRLEKLTDGKRK